MLSNSPKLNRKITKLILIILGCLAYFVYRALGTTFFAQFVGAGENVPLKANMITSILMGLIFGGFIGIFEVFLFQDRFKRRSFGYAILVKSLIFFLLIVIISYSAAFFYVAVFEEGKSIFDPMVLEGVAYFSDSGGFTFYLLDIGLLVLIIQFVIQVNDKFGQGVLWRFLKGNYHQPREEERIFMFLDLKSSTTLAEKLGHIQFFSLVSDFVSDVTDPILENQGEIYQYVGDEVVLSWKVSRGVKQAQCLKCFLDIQEKIDQQSQAYMEKYGVVPEFKAGIHIGMVTTGEIGVIKREITHSGDVLNTAARIEGECNRLGVNILFSEELYQRLDLEETGYRVKEIGEIQLRGKRGEDKAFYN